MKKIQERDGVMVTKCVIYLVLLNCTLEMVIKMVSFIKIKKEKSVTST